METMLARIIVQVFAKRPLIQAQYPRLRTKTAAPIAAEGHRLVDLVIDLGPPKRDPADQPSLLRFARGEADGSALFTLPMSISPKQTTDVLQSQRTGPFLLLNAAELADRGLLPGGTRYQRHGAKHHRQTAQPAARACRLHA